MSNHFHYVKATCVSCNFFKVWEKQSDDRMTVGDCRLNPPGNYQIGENKFMTKWPSVKSTDYCGKFSPRLKPITEIKAP